MKVPSFVKSSDRGIFLTRFQTELTKIGGNRFRPLNVFLWPVPGKNMLQVNTGNFLLDYVMPDDAGITTGGF